MDIISLLLEFTLTPLRYGFMQRGLLATIMVGALCASVGAFIIVQRLAFIGDAMAHSIFPGVVIAFLLKAHVLVGALAMGILTAIVIGMVGRRGRVSEDTAIGVLFAGAFALGVALLSTVRTYSTNLSEFLLGNVLGVSSTDLILMGAIGAMTMGIIILFYKELVLVAFDPTAASAMGLPTDGLHHLLLVLIALVIIVSLQTVGNILVVAMLVTPAATASLLVRRFPHIMVVGSAIGAASGMVGLYASYYAGIAPGASIVLVATFFFLLALLFSPRHGLITDALRRRRQPSGP